MLVFVQVSWWGGAVGVWAFVLGVAAPVELRLSGEEGQRSLSRLWSLLHYKYLLNVAPYLRGKKKYSGNKKPEVLPWSSKELKFQ